MKHLRWLALLAAMSSSACQDLGLGPRRQLTPIEDIQVADSTAATDSLRVSFWALYGSCDTAVKAEVLSLPGVRSFSVSIKPKDCVEGTGILQKFSYVFPPSQRANPFRLVFRQNVGDVTRTVVWR